MENAKNELMSVEYKLPSGEELHITYDMVKNFLTSGNGKLSDQEIVMFLQMCKYCQLNPFTKECYLIKYDDKAAATMVVSKEAYVKRARQSSNFIDYKAGVVVFSNGEIKEREGTICLPNEELIGGWVKVYTKNNPNGFYHSVLLSEYIGKNKYGEANNMWKGKPATMIRKVAIAQGLREQFPEMLNGLYTEEEIPRSFDNTEPASENSVKYEITDDVVYESVPQSVNAEELSNALKNGGTHTSANTSNEPTADGVIEIYYSEYKNNKDKYEPLPDGYNKYTKKIRVKVKPQTPEETEGEVIDNAVDDDTDLPF